MPRDDRQPFDIEAHEAADITQQFWGATRGWDPVTGDEPSVAEWDDRTPRSIQALRSGLAGMRPRRAPQSARRSDATGRIDRTRAHGIPRPESFEDLELARRDATLGELAAGWIDDDIWPDLPTRPTRQVRADVRRPPDFEQVDESDEFEDLDDDELVPLSPVAPLASRLGLGAVDPLLARLGAIVVVGIMLIPVALSARGGGADPTLAGDVVSLPTAQTAQAASTIGDQRASDSVAATAVQVAATAPATAAAIEAVAATVATNPPAATAAVPSSEQAAASSTVAGTVAGDVAQSVSVSTPAPAEVATVSVQAERLEPECSLKYEAGAGDSWYRIASAADVSPSALMDANLAGTDTPIFPGDEICLPDGASMPSKPTSTTAAPVATTAAPPPPTTTVKPTTTTAPPPAPVSTGAVQDLIREIWPDELEEKALQIAYRESNYKAGAFNGSCCYGVFQLNWSSHRSWLDDYGITSANDLLDARKNITAAYALYQRSGGWGPWGG